MLGFYGLDLFVVAQRRQVGEMGYSRYVGRIGALAVALGVGIAIGGPGGVASAAPTDCSTTAGPAVDGGAEPEQGEAPSASAPSETVEANSEGSSLGDVGADASKPKDRPPTDAQVEKESPSSSTVEVAPGVTVASSGGAHTSADSAGKRTPKPKSPKRSLDEKKAAAPAGRVVAQTNASHAVEIETQTADEATERVTGDIAANAVVAMTSIAPQPVSAKIMPSPVTAEIGRAHV